jgi:magnesium transporter
LTVSRAAYRKRRYHKPGTAPGTYDIAETREAPPGHVEVIDYSDDDYEKSDGLRALERRQTLPNRWVQIDGQPSLDVLETTRKRYGIDPLALEDIVNQGQRPKFNEYTNGIFLTLALPSRNGEGTYRQLSLYVMDGVLISFTELEDGIFAPLEERLRRPGGRLRRRDVYFLMHAIIDLVIDLLFPVIDQTAQRLEELEEAIITRPTEERLVETHAFRSRLLVMRKVAWATREVVNELRRHIDEISTGELRPYLEDAYDHIVSAIDLIETQRDIATNLVEVYMSVVSNRMNDVIKVLTIIATLFIPPTFLVGLYGMNFDRSAGPLSMPELGWPLGYLGVLVVIAASMIGMLIYFRRRGWLGGGKDDS